MTEITNNNLQAHYSGNTKVNLVKKGVAEPPKELPNMHLYNDTDANKKLRAFNNEINEGCKKEKNKDFSLFLKTIVGTALAILALFGIKKFFKKS